MILAFYLYLLPFAIYYNATIINIPTIFFNLANLNTQICLNNAKKKGGKLFSIVSYKSAGKKVSETKQKFYSVTCIKR